MSTNGSTSARQLLQAAFTSPEKVERVAIAKKPKGTAIMCSEWFLDFKRIAIVRIRAAFGWQSFCNMSRSHMQEQKDAYLPVELGIPSSQLTNYFCKTLTASDTSTHGGFSVLLRKVSHPWISHKHHLLVKNLSQGISMMLNGKKFRHIFRDMAANLVKEEVSLGRIEK